MFERTYTLREQRDQLEMELAEAIDTLIDAEEELKAKQEYIEALEAQVEMLEEEVELFESIKAVLDSCPPVAPYQGLCEFRTIPLNPEPVIQPDAPPRWSGVTCKRPSTHGGSLR